ncbi:MAG: hypothetical protein LBU07_03920 [Coriobacteriales bacterium]|jgi:hypothetical protein|nr:hypothetical protein [Coriobacteriales bacterium]
MIDEFINDLRPARDKIAFINESAYEHNLTDEDIYYVIDNYIGMFEARSKTRRKSGMLAQGEAALTSWKW